MGLFTRFRTPSGSGPSSSSGGRPTTPGPSSHPYDPTPASGRASTSLGRQSSYFDNSYEDAAPTPRPKEKEKERKGFGWKGKGKADLGGRPYEEHYPHHAPSDHPDAGLADRRTKGEKRITAIFTPHPHPPAGGGRPTTPSSYADLVSPRSPISPRSDRTVHSGSTERAKARTMSEDFAQDGGVLGRLMFEKEKPRSPAAEKKKRDVPSWLAGSGSEEEFDLMRDVEVSRENNRQGAPPSAFVPPSISAPAGFGAYGYGQPSEQRRDRFPPVPVRKESVDQPVSAPMASRGDVGGSAISDGEDDEPVHVNKDAGGKKGRFWAGKGRRASKAGEIEAAGSRATSPTPTPRKHSQMAQQPGSPMPRKTSLPPVPPSKSAAASIAASPVLPDHSLPPVSTARPSNPNSHNIRRPSSSFFSNPFARTTSRSSIFTDIDSSVVDDGSFQLKGFRHVSGISQLDVSAPEPKQAQVQGQGYANGSILGLADLNLTTSPVVSDTHTDDKWDLPPPVRPSLARPSSSASIRTIDSQHAESPKVSVAAFKKGIRRPSEGYFEGMNKSAVDDDDDVPLGVLNKGFARTHSSLSLSDQAQSSGTREVPKISPALPVSPSLADLAKSHPSVPTPSTRIAHLSQPPSREPSPGPHRTLSPAQGGRPGGHQRNGGGSGGFVVRSAQSTRSAVSLGAGSPGGGASRATSPIVDGGSEEVIISPPEGEKGSYFSPKTSVNGLGKPTNAPQPIPAPALIPAPEPSRPQSTMVERNVNLPPTSSTTKIQPTITTNPEGAATSVEPDLHHLVLPPRPSEIPDEPLPRVRSPSAQHSPSTADFSRRISSFLAPVIPPSSATTAPQTKEAAVEDGFDPALVVHSMAAFSEPSSPQRNGARPSLQARLGQVAGGSKPAVAPINTDVGAGGRKGVRSPDSDTTTTPTGLSGGAQLHGGKAKLDKSRARTRTVSGKGKEGWSSSESEDEYGAPEVPESKVEEEDVPVSSFRKPAGPRSPPRTNRAITPVPPPTQSAKPAVLAVESDADSDSSSEEETLAVIRAKASRSTLALNTYASAPSAPSQRGFRSPSSPNLSLSPPRTGVSLASPPKVGFAPKLPPITANPHSPQQSPPKSSPKKALSPPALHTPFGLPSSGSSGAIAPRRSPLSQSLSSTQLNQDASPPLTAGVVVSAQPSASPASSQSGLTGDSLLQPVTPRETSVGAKGGRVPVAGHGNGGKGKEHSRTESRDSTQPSNVYGGARTSSSTSMSSMSPSTEERQRRFSQTSMPTLAPQIQPMPPVPPQAYPPNMDPAAIRNLMKQQWQAQFMAAAYQAAEDEWERASSVGGPGMSMMGGSESGQSSAYSAFAAGQGGHMGMPPMPAYGYGYPAGTGMGMPPQFMPPAGYGMPAMAMPQIGGFPPVQPGGQGGGMYSYAPGAQSVYGGDFGPSVAQQPQHQFQQPYLQYQQQQQFLQQQYLHSQQPQHYPHQQQQAPHPDPSPFISPSSSSHYISSPLSQPHGLAESAGGPIRQRPRQSSRTHTSQPLIGIDENSGHRQQPRVKDRASSYNIGSTQGGLTKSGMSSSGSMGGLSAAMNGGIGSQPPPTSWRRSTSEWGGEGAAAAVPAGQRKSRGGFAS